MPVSPRTRSNCSAKIAGEEIAETLAYGLLARDAAELLELGVPAFDAIVQIGRQDADVDRFDDVFAEFLEPLVLVDLALQRAVEAWRFRWRCRHIRASVSSSSTSTLER